MNQHISALCLLSLMSLLSSCGQNVYQQVSSESPSQKAPERETSESILTLTAADLKVNPNPTFISWEVNLPSLEQLETVKELRIQFAEIASYAFNEVDMYIDPYNADDIPIFPFIQVALPISVSRKGDSEVQFRFPGKDVSVQTKSLKDMFEKAETKLEGAEICNTIRVRILLTDNREPGNPVKIALIGTLWQGNQ